MLRGFFGKKEEKESSLPVLISYDSKEVDTPDDYLQTEPHDAIPITFSPIDFEKSVLPEYKGGYAVVLDHVLSPSECAKLIELAESSVLDEDKEKDSSWRPARIAVGGGYEVLVPDYRNGDRIIWDNQTIVDRIWARIETRPEIKESLSSFATNQMLGGATSGRYATTWNFHRVNQRMRFLKYGKGGFFKPHCDSSYSEMGEDGKVLQTHYTIHLYLNDSKQVVGDAADLVGGATSFLSHDDERKIDVDPKAGRVLIFQHRRLRHSGDDVKAGTKYTVRTDIMYRSRT